MVRTKQTARIVLPTHEEVERAYKEAKLASMNKRPTRTDEADDAPEPDPKVDELAGVEAQIQTLKKELKVLNGKRQKLKDELGL